MKLANNFLNIWSECHLFRLEVDTIAFWVFVTPWNMYFCSIEWWRSCLHCKEYVQGRIILIYERIFRCISIALLGLPSSILDEWCILYLYVNSIASRIKDWQIVGWSSTATVFFEQVNWAIFYECATDGRNLSSLEIIGCCSGFSNRFELVEIEQSHHVEWDLRWLQNDTDTFQTLCYYIIRASLSWDLTVGKVVLSQGWWIVKFW